jgi:hypothetical protein
MTGRRIIIEPPSNPNKLSANTLEGAFDSRGVNIVRNLSAEKLPK